MKSDIIYKELEEELRDWMRPFASSVIVAKSFKGEETVPEGQKQTQDVVPIDPLAGIDLENLPDEAKQAIIKMKENFASLQTEAKTAKQTAEANDLLAKQHQSRADRYDTELRKHNLHPQQQQQQTDPDAEVVEELTKKFIAKGLPPDQAKIHAQLHAEAVKLGEERTLKKVGAGLSSTVQSVGNLNIDRILEQASQTKDYGEYMRNPAIVAQTREVLSTITASGGTIDEKTFRVAVSMALGELSMSGKLNNQQQNNNASQPNIFGNGSFFNNPPMINPNNPQGGQPIAKNADTEKAVAGVVASMRMGLANKKK